ncbi:MAG: 50S ribosomal protein L18 [Patescibacteria group bacterium]|nr:50S ribosomal protein L18 [Patescibacteria group bacterium]
MKITQHQTLAQKRARRVRSKMMGTAVKPRVSVFRSNKSVFVQAIDDVKRVTLASVHGKSLVKSQTKKVESTKTQKAVLVGEKIGQILKEKKIKTAIFDRGANRYHGRVKAVAEGLRSQGIKV